MLFNVGFHDRSELAEAARRQIRSRWPHLRLIPLVDPEELPAAVEQLPPHVAKIVHPNPDASTISSLSCVVSSNPTTTQELLPQIPSTCIVDWDGIASAYDTWMHQWYLPFHRLTALYTPDGLRPVDVERESLSLEVVGSCGARFVLHYTDELSKQLDLELSTSFITHNHPVAVNRGSDPRPDVQLVLPPLRFMHPDTLDDFIIWSDHEQRFNEVVAHLQAYLERIDKGLPALHRFVAGFVEPFANPVGYDIDRGSIANFKIFVRGLNDVIANWCEQHENTWFVDANEISAAIGRGRSDEDLIRNVAHRAAANPMDDWVDEAPITDYSVADSYDIQTAPYYLALLREVFCRRTTILGKDIVKLVIIDLDNTLWRGLATDGHLGPWAGRPAGIAEALRVLRRRGILTAIASKNDPDFIAEHWSDLLGDMSDEPLGMNLSMDEFVTTKISFQPKSISVREILEATNISSENAVFIDDNPLEREEVQAAFPDLRVLGSELNYVRRELLYSPYTQRPLLTDEDAQRTEMTKARVAFHDQVSKNGDASNYLHALGLSLSVQRCMDPASEEGRRCLQLINRTNQWNLSGIRIEEPDFINSVSSANAALIYGKAKDSTSSYGIVAVALLDLTSHEISTMAVSCRVIGMGIDDALMAAVLDAFGPVLLQFSTTERNQAALAFINNHCGGDGRLVSCSVPSHIELSNRLHLEQVAAPHLQLETTSQH